MAVGCSPPTTILQSGYNFLISKAIFLAKNQACENKDVKPTIFTSLGTLFKTSFYDNEK